MSEQPNGISGQRVRRDKGSENIRRDALQDPRLSFKATGILGYLLSLPDNWRTNADRLSKAKNGAGKAKEGREAMQSGLRELEEAGYLVRRKFQDDRGTWRWTWRYSDDPADLQEQDVSAGQTVDGSADYGSPVDGSPVDIEGLRGRDLRSKEDLTPSVSADARTETEPPQLVLLPPSEAAVKPATNGTAESFDRFWKVYPRKIAKQDARKAWDKAVKGVSPAVIIAGAGRYAAERAREDPRGKFTKHPASWLNSGRWEDEASADPELWRQFSEEIGSPAAYAADDYRRFVQE